MRDGTCGGRESHKEGMDIGPELTEGTVERNSGWKDMGEREGAEKGRQEKDAGGKKRKMLDVGKYDREKGIGTV